jgi:hypothetical protein
MAWIDALALARDAGIAGEMGDHTQAGDLA